MAKKIKARLERNYDSCWLVFENKLQRSFCWKELKILCPELCKGLRKGQERELVLTQTQTGIKLERAGDKR